MKALDVPHLIVEYQSTPHSCLSGDSSENMSSEDEIHVPVVSKKPKNPFPDKESSDDDSTSCSDTV